MSLEKIIAGKLGVVGLGYVGLSVAVEFAKRYDVVGFDCNDERIASLLRGEDTGLQIASDKLKPILKKNGHKYGLTLVSDGRCLEGCDIFIVAVPTPVDYTNVPDLEALKLASATIGKCLKTGAIVIYESTVYPGVTEGVCAPILEHTSGLAYNLEFFCGYSPERINPSDKQHTLTTIRKITSGSTPEVADVVDALYSSIIEAGTYKAPSIMVAEAAKLVENTQRDVNIALINEVSKILQPINLDTKSVLDAANTKWNFQYFTPGLVGGHCISVDPYYLAYLALENGVRPELVLTARSVNNDMAQYVVTEVIKHMIKRDLNVRISKFLMLGFAFKENCPDTRNTGAFEVYKHLREYGVQFIDVYDNLVNFDDVKSSYGIQLVPNLLKKSYDCIINIVAHDSFKDLDLISLKRNDNCLIYDVKSVLPGHLGAVRL